MIKRTFGSTGQSLPVIGQGSWNFSGGKAEIEKATAALRTGIEQGMDHIDTAEMYGDGRSEEIIGQAISGLARENLFLVSKVLPGNATYKGTISACEKSLRRLKTDYLDCYLLHWRGSHPLSETIRGFEKLIEDGKIRSMGVSNFDVDDLQEAIDCASKPIACNQILYNLFTRAPERQLMPFCTKHKIAVVAYTPFAQKKPPQPGTITGDLLQDIADKHNATVSQVILAFLVRDENVFTIPKAAEQEHVIENAGAGKFKLTDNDIRRISDAFPAPDRDIPLQTL
jgi:diketogulonate reductase-like aldo/keto reductase